MDGVLELLPRAQKQAHERIIGARQVPNGEKILSLYEPEVRVIVRGKAGAEVEFGNTVLLGENRQGVILDYEIFRQSAPADSQILFGSLLRVREGTGRDVGGSGERSWLFQCFQQSHAARGEHVRRVVSATAGGPARENERGEVRAVATPPGSDRGADRHSQAQPPGPANESQRV
ncbi:MAG: hypothetical protein ABSA69_02370 [Verrucomicrobiota bacterium]